MFPPCEMMVKDFLPATRGLVIHRLRQKGLSESRIGSLLGITQAAVSQYLAKPSAHYKKRLLTIGVPEDTVISLENILSMDVLENPVKSTYTLYAVWKDLLSKGIMCDYHRKVYPQLSNCDVCLKSYSTDSPSISRLNVIKSIEEAISIIETFQPFVNIMPEVYVNIAMALEGASSEEDVAAIPGRIVRVKSKAKAISKPEFGVSHHLANVLLAAIKTDPSIRAVMNIKFDKKVEHIIKKIGLKFIYTPKRKEGLPGEDLQLKAVRSSLLKIKKVPDCIIDRGGYAYEPITYIFGKDAVDVAKKSLAIAEGYASSIS